MCIVGVVVLALALASASPLDSTNPEQETTTGSKTFHAIRAFFRPMTDYLFKKLPSKTPSDVATDVQEKVTDVRQWAEENQMIQSLVSSLAPVKSWIKEKANTLQDKTFRDMYNDVKERVSGLDQKIGAWIEQHNQQ